MPRPAVLLAALAVSTLTIAAGVDAAAPTELEFRIQERAGNEIRGDFRRVGPSDTQWNSDFHPAEFAGLDRAGLSAATATPIRFALVRDAGRLDCAGTGSRGTANGRCRYSPNQNFAAFLRANGVGKVSDEQQFTMTAVGVRRELLTTLHRAQYSAPAAGELINLTALGVDEDYISGLSASGNRPPKIDTLIQYKALGISPSYIARLRAAGMPDITPSMLIQFRALGIDAEYVSAVARAGYPNLPASTLVEFRALGVTAEYLAALRRRGLNPTPSKIVQMKALGITAEDVDAVDRSR
ncbi:hypothetical protein [Sphingomonas mesophila]|uniref:hypothetical protein n=1 Tax=Sphingomonas mesophila TaxID=2303576 RepID=UPI0013C37B49|nr:hypothetical protein [Sphingomonas mesophila]